MPIQGYVFEWARTVRNGKNVVNEQERAVYDYGVAVRFQEKLALTMADDHLFNLAIRECIRLQKRLQDMDVYADGEYSILKDEYRLFYYGDPGCPDATG